MMRQIIVLSWIVAALISCVDAHATTFYSGRIDIDPSAAGGKPKSGVKQLGLLGAGIGYHNEWTAGNSGLAGIGSKVTSVGVVPISTVRIGNSLESLKTGLNLVAVYAFEGVTEMSSRGTAPARTNFDPSVSVPNGSLPGAKAGGVVRIYDRTDPTSGIAPALDAIDPRTWVQNLTNPSAGILAEMMIDVRASEYRQGAPSGSATTIPVVVDGDAVNTTPMDATGALLAAVADFLLQLESPSGSGARDGNSFFNRSDIRADTGMYPQSPLDLLLRIEQTPQLPGAQPIPSSADLALIDQLFDALMDAIVAGEHHFSDGSLSGNGFNTAQDFATGDFSLENSGGTAIPGRRFLVVEGPEPFSILIWAVMLAFGLFSATFLRRN